MAKSQFELSNKRLKMYIVGDLNMSEGLGQSEGFIFCTESDINQEHANKTIISRYSFVDNLSF